MTGRSRGAIVDGAGRRSKRGGTRTSQSRRTELRLLRTTTTLFSTRGFHGTGIRDIAEAAEVAVSAMYYYASSKEDLLEAVMARGMDMLTNGATRALEGLDGPSERLATLVGVHVAVHARNPHTTRVVDQEFRALTGAMRTAALERRDAYEAIWASVLEDGVRRGEFTDWGGVDRLALIQMATGVAHWYHPDGRLSVPELCERFSDMALALVGATRDGRRLAVKDLDVPSMAELLPQLDIDSEPVGRAR